MKFEIIENGFIYDNSSKNDGLVACTSRCAVNDNGQLLCSFMLNSGLGMNDFTPYLAVSEDCGLSWTVRGKIWPQLQKNWSINVSISRAADGRLFLFGSRTPRGADGESFWCQETLGILLNEMIWASSSDGGQTWSPPQPLKTPLPGAVESPAPLCVTHTGRWAAPYSPHNTFDPNLKVDLQHVVAMITDDCGTTWKHNSAIRVSQPDAYVAESWITELSDGRLLVTTWHLSRNQGDDYPNAFAISHDNAQTWSKTYSTGIMGQSAATAPLPDGKVLFVYNQRRHGTPGVWLALAKPKDNDFGIILNEPVWLAATATQNNSSGKSLNWTDFAFGEPSVTVLPDGGIIAAFWCIQPSGSGIGFVKLKIA